MKFSLLLATEPRQTLKLVNLLHLCHFLPAQTPFFSVFTDFTISLQK